MQLKPLADIVKAKICEYNVKVELNNQLSRLLNDKTELESTIKDVCVFCFNPIIKPVTETGALIRYLVELVTGTGKVGTIKATRADENDFTRTEAPASRGSDNLARMT